MKLFQKVLINILVFVFLTALFTDLLSAKEISGTEMKVIIPEVEALAKKHGAENVLVVFDIDNTLLTSKGDLGSDQWFIWQQSLLFKHPENKALVAKDFNGLLDAFGIILTINSLKTSDPDTAKILKKIQNYESKGKKVKTISLTSRGYQYQLATIRELKKNGIDFSCCDPEVGKKISVDVWDSHFPKKSGKGYRFSKEEVKAFKFNRSPRKLLYNNGVFFTAGMHKGAMLRVFFHKLGYTPKAVIFVDDKEKHTKSVHSAFKGKGVEIVTLRFSREDSKVESFHKGSKEKVTKQWGEFVKAFDSIDPETIEKNLEKVLSN